MNATVWKGKAPARLRSGYALPPPCGGLPLPNGAHEVHCKSLQFQCRLHLQFRCRLIRSLRPWPGHAGRTVRPTSMPAGIPRPKKRTFLLCVDTMIQ